MYNEQTTVSRTISPDGDGSNKKKRKVATVNIPDDDEDDVMTMYGHGVPKGKKAKGGTGYAGSLKEDVSDACFPRVLGSDALLRYHHRQAGKRKRLRRNKCATLKLGT